MWNAIGAYLASKLADEVWSLLRDPLLADLDSRGGATTREQLNRIEGKIEQQLMAPLHAGMTFLRLGNPRKAVEEFVRAEALEAYSPAAKFWLGFSLGLVGQEAKGKEFIHLSVEQNPFFVASLLHRNPSTLLGLAPPDLVELGREWDLKLPNKRLAKDLPGRSMFSDDDSAAIQHVSTMNGWVVMSWLLGSSLDFSCDNLVSVIDPRDGNPCWHRRSRELEFVLATPQFVVVGETADGVHKILDIESGRELRVMSRPYFEISFGDSNGHPGEAHWAHFASPREVFQLTIGKERSFLHGFLRGFHHDIKHEVFNEEAGLSLPGTESGRILIRNIWKHEHTARVVTIAMGPMPECKITGTAYLSLQKGEAGRSVAEKVPAT